MPILSTQSLCVGHRSNRGSQTTAANINLQIEQGKMICLLGKNGIGKSTLLHTLAGFLPPISGKIFIENIPSESISAQKLAQKISVVLTNCNRIDNMSVTELVALGRMPYTNLFGRLTNSDWDIVNAMIDKVGIGPIKNKLINQISDGERQRAMIAKALTQQTPIVILDEPTAFLDLPGRISIMNLLQELAHTENIAIVQSTHDLEQALRFADTLWLMNDENISVGAPEDLVLSGKLSQTFDNHNLQFDANEGIFITTKNPIATIGIDGEGLQCIWLQRALMRIGIATDNAARQRIVIDKNTYHFGNFRADTIEDILQIVLQDVKKKQG